MNQRPPDKLCSTFRARGEAAHLPGYLPTGSERQEKQPRLPEGSDTATVTELPAGEWKEPPHANTAFGNRRGNRSAGHSLVLKSLRTQARDREEILSLWGGSEPDIHTKPGVRALAAPSAV